MKHINKISAFAGLALILSTASLQASFDNSAYSSPQNLSALLSEQQSDSPNYGSQSASGRSSFPGHHQVIPSRTPNALVPEPTTVIAGALLLLPFGVSAVRILRRNQVSQLK